MVPPALGWLSFAVSASLYSDNLFRSDALGATQRRCYNGIVRLGGIAERRQMGDIRFREPGPGVTRHGNEESFHPD